MKNPLTIHSDSSESLHYNIKNLPLYTHKDLLSNYDYKALIHWHLDLEFIYIVKGAMDYYVNGQMITIKQGDGIFVNSQRLHYGFSNEHQECIFIALVISPELFINISLEAKEYMKHKFSFKNPDYIYLDNLVLWQKEILNTIVYIYEQMNSEHFRLLLIISQAIGIIDMIGEHIDDCQENNDNSSEQELFFKMISYIATHYHQTITINDLCKHVGISRNKCCSLFQQFTQNTFTSYLVHYRIDKSVYYLKNTHLSILEISQLCGFSSASYFTSVFKKVKGCTPKDLQKKMNK